MDLSRILLGEDDAFLHSNVRIDAHPESTTPKLAKESKFDDDVEALRRHYGEEQFTHGAIFELSLAEILEIVPRNRRRRDAYVSLGKYLKEQYDIKLIIK